MLQNIRDNAQGTIARIIVGLIILTFAVFGTDAIVQSLYGDPVVAEVNGEEITQAEFERQVERQRRQVIAQQGENFDPSRFDLNQLRQNTLRELLDTRILQQAALSGGMGISDTQIDQFIVNWPPAQVDGRFDAEQFRRVIGSIGMGPVEFRNELRQQLLIGQLQAGIGESAFVADFELEQLLRLESQTRDFAWQRLSVDTVLENVEISDAAVSAYYEENQDNLRLPDRVQLSYLHVTQAGIAAEIEISDADLQSAYADRVAEFESREQRRSAHILLETGDDRTVEAAVQELSAIRERVLGGESFAELAREVSEDFGTAADGGDLGLLLQGTMGDEAFDAALFALSPGELSEPVVTRYGVHLIQLQDIAGATAPTLAELRGELTQTLRQRRAEDRYVELVTELADLTFSAPDLEEAAAELDILVDTSPILSREGIPGEPLWSNPRVLEQAFSVDVLEEEHNSEVIEIGRDQLLVLRKQRFLPSEIPPLDLVAEEIELELKREEAKKLLQEQVATLSDEGQVRSAENGWEIVEGLTRRAAATTVGGTEAFSLPAPDAEETVTQAFEQEDGYLLVSLLSVSNEPSAIVEVQREALAPLLAQRAGGQEFAVFQRVLQSQAVIDRNP